MAATQTRVFKSSLTSRRFPALRTLTNEDVEVMVMPAASPRRSEDGGSARQPFAPHAAAAVTAASSSPFASAAIMPPKGRPPFRPSNPSEARSSITDVQHGYVGMHSPFELAHKMQMLERAEARKGVLGGAYLPPSAAKAKKAIAVNYYLNSPDAETIEAERRYIQEKAQRNMVEYYRRASPRGQ